MDQSIPKTMQAILLKDSGQLTLGEVALPALGTNQVLIRMSASPINPSDLGFLKGAYGFQKPFPVVPGFEGSGRVVAVGSGLLSHFLRSKRVAFSAAQGGAWAEYAAISASNCVPLPKQVTFDQGSMMIVNPMSALAFFEIAKQERHAAIVSNAAAGALGRMILRLGQIYRKPVIHLVRRAEQVELLRSLGGEYVLDSNAPDFYAQLRMLSSRLKATLILDPVGGEQTRQLLDATPKDSTIVVYGSLAGKRDTPHALGTGDKRIKGFFLPDWLAKRGALRVFLDVRRAQHLAPQLLQTPIQTRLPLSAAEQGIKMYQANLTAGKVLFVTA